MNPLQKFPEKKQTLRNWRDKQLCHPGTDAIPDNWSTQDKFLVVVGVSELQKGLFTAGKKGNQI